MEVTDSSGPSTSGVTVTSSSNAKNIATGSPGNDGLTVTSIPVQPAVLVMMRVLLVQMVLC